jgi:hypothetical protein
MRHVLFAFAVMLGTSLAPAQGTEWVTNGTFTGGLAPWVMGGGFSVNSGHEVGWDTTGMGPSDSYGTQAGGQVLPPPYPPNWIEQQILVVQGLTYEFRCDASGARPLAPTVANADTGTIWVEVDNVEVARHAFGSYVVPLTKRAQVCGRFTPTTSGMVTLRINTARTFLANGNTPRINIDNVSVKDVIGPTFWVAGNRKIGTAVTHKVRGSANAVFATFAALAENPAGIAFPGITGLFLLDPPTAVTVSIGVLDLNGESDTSVTIPLDNLFVVNPLWFQAGAWDALGIALGYHFGIVCTT